MKKLLIEDLKGAPDWVRPLVVILNPFMELTYQALNRNITFDQNIAAFTRDIIYKTPSTYPTGVEQVSFMNELKLKPIGVTVIQAYDRSNYVPAPGPVYAPWVDDNNTIRIGTITGLEANKTYVVRLLVI